MAKVKVPQSTYRLQLHKGFTFDDAAKIADYLWTLGISHVYSSPYLQAAPDSTHGYDVVDHQRVNGELGGLQAHTRFSKVLGENGLGQILDIVPNHMAIGAENRFWWDVLENGASSRYASFFDIDWNPQEQRLKDKVLVPVLGDQYGKVLEAGGITVQRQGAKFTVQAAGQQLPVAPTSMPAILSRAAIYAASDPLNFAAASFGRLPTPSPDDRRTVLARHRDKIVISALLDRFCNEEAHVCEAIDRAVKELNADHDALDDFLNQQNYRLAYWKTADQQLGYRRFFDVNTLIGLRMERDHVFEETHALVLDWLKQGVLDGVRVDHPDGLRDPAQYFARLREHAPEAWIVGEKILARDEFLRPAWPIEGTSGYDFLNMVNGLLVAPAGMDALTHIYGDFTAEPTDFPSIAHDKKIAVTQEALGSDVNRLTNLFVDVCEQHRNQRDTTRADVRRAIRELAGCFGVYRTYVFPETPSGLGQLPRPAEITDEDRRIIHCAVECARNNRPDIDPGLFEFFEQVLTLEEKGTLESEFVLRFQQFTSPVMAKGVEDTAFYCFNRLTSLCEVGSDPGKNGVTLDAFHAYQQKMQQTHPCTMTTLATHDTKRSDDVRARLAVLSEVPDYFAQAISRWSAANARYRTNNRPDPNTEYFLYQTLIGAWPITPDRTKAYLQKAMREAKQQTSWVANNKDFEDALNSFIDNILADEAFTQDLEQFVQRILVAGRINALTQTLIKHIAPGVPDLYQGTELWDLSLVDPDNRRPVDYGLRRKLLAALPSIKPEAMTANLADLNDAGIAKLHVVHTALKLRREQPEHFGPQAAYTPLTAEGRNAGHIVAYTRGERVLTIAPIHAHTAGSNWADTTLDLPAPSQSGRWHNTLTNEDHNPGPASVAKLLQNFPVALLTWTLAISTPTL